MTRKTRQREAIMQVFETHPRPLTIAEILEYGQSETESLNQATVYRNINRLVREGVLLKVEYPPVGVLYERSDKPHHHHFHCTQCDKLYELAGCPVNVARAAPDEYQIEGHELYLYGTCPACQDLG